MKYMKLTNNTKIFIIGCAGMLGEAIYNKFSKYCDILATDININEKWIQYGDVRNYYQMFEMIHIYKPDLIINLAALTDLEECENNKRNTWLTNALGAENMALISKKLDIPHIYISTAGVFDGEQNFYNDFEKQNPLNTYAKAKCHGEIIVQKMLSKYYIFRAGWMMGGGYKKDKKFVNKIFKQIINGHKELFIVNDKFGTPTYTIDFANNIFEVIKTDLYGLYNIGCQDSCSRYDIAVEFLKLLGLEDKIKITIVDSDYFKKEYFALRPYSEKLINLKLQNRNMDYMRDWKECLKEYINNEYKKLL